MKTKLVIPFIVFLQAFSCMAQQKAVLTFGEAKQLADRGDARAQAIAAMHYQLGWQTEKNEALAGKYAQASAEAGHPLGIYRLGNLLVSGINGQKDPATGYKLQATSVEKIEQLLNPNGNNDPYAQLAYGIMAFQGKVLPQDKSTAVKAYHHAAAQGLAPAVFNYIMAAIDGQGMPKDKMAYYHFLMEGGLTGVGCDCAVCSMHKSINTLNDYTPAERYVKENALNAKCDLNKHAMSMGYKKLDDIYWEYELNNETKVLEPLDIKGESEKWHNLMSINTDTGVIDILFRTNYTGLVNRGYFINNNEDMHKQNNRIFEHDLSNGGLFGSIQYIANKTSKGLEIKSTTPISFKNRMGIHEYPVALEVKITNNSKHPIEFDQFGFYVDKCNLKSEILPGLIFEEGKNENENKIIFHNFGWGNWDHGFDAKITLWHESAPISEESVLRITSKESVSKNVSSIFRNSYLLKSLFNHPDYDARKISLEIPAFDKSEKILFNPNFCRQPAGFFTKIRANVTLPSDRSNYRFLFDAKKKIEPGGIFTFNTMFEFDKSVNCALKPIVKINEEFIYGNAINLEYDTYNYYYKPNETFSIDGNGDATIHSLQREILGIESIEKESEKQVLIKNGRSALTECNTNAVIQMPSSVQVHDFLENENIFYENDMPDKKNKLVISAKREGGTLLGHISIFSNSRNQVLFRAPWCFEDFNLADNDFNLSVAISNDGQWVSWLIKDSSKRRLYCVYPKNSSSVYAPSSPNMPKWDNHRREHDKCSVLIDSETENDIESIGLDCNGKGLVVKTKKGSYIIPLGSRLANSVLASFKASGLGIIGFEPTTDMVDSLRLNLQLPIIDFSEKQFISDVKKCGLPNHNVMSAETSGLLFVSEGTIALKKSGKWEIWSLSTGQIYKATAAQNKSFDIENSNRDLSSGKLINNLKTKDKNWDTYVKKTYAVEVNSFIVCSFDRVNRTENELEINFYDPINYSLKSEYCLSLTPFRIAQQIAKKSEFFYKIAISPDQRVGVAASKSGNILYIFDVKKSQKLVNPSRNAVNLCIVRSPSNKNICTVVNSDGFYLSGDGRAEGVVLSDGLNAMNVAQLEVKYNRPDIILGKLGAPKETLDEAKRLGQRLARRSDFKNLEGASLIDVPVVTLPTDTPSSTGDIYLKIPYSATNSSGNLKELLVYNNGALVSKSPLVGKNGESGLDAEGVVNLHLASGENKIQLCAVNEDGVPSNFAEKVITCTSQPSSRNYYIVTCGVSEYQDTNFNLRFAAKDAVDVAEALKKSSESRGFTPKVLTLTNAEVDSEAVAKIRNFLATASADDEVFLFFAGHGLLDKDLNYHYARSDTDFSVTENIGIQFDELESLVDCIKPLKRTVLFDTCHSGEVEEESKADVRAMVAGQTVDPSEASNVQSTKIATRGMKVNVIAPKVSHSELINLEKLFPDSRRAKGANILTSSSGSEFSMESAEWNNGLFTYALVKTLQETASDINNDRNISFYEVAEYVRKKVIQLSGGRQQPITRGINREWDQILAKIDDSVIYENPSNQGDGNPDYLLIKRDVDKVKQKNKNFKDDKILEFQVALAKANAGDAHAQAVVSIYYGLGMGCDPDHAKSKDYVMLSAKQQNPLGIYRLAEMREVGEGMDQNSEQALQLMKKAKPGLQKLSTDPYALTALATIYERENPDSPKIREVLTKASEMGYEPAAEKLSNLEGSKY